MQTKKTIMACFVFAAICFALFSFSSINVKAAGALIPGNVTVKSVPSVGTVTIWNSDGEDAAIDLSAGGTVTVTANATITDFNEWEDIANASAVLYYSSAGDEDSNNTHITNSTCALSEADPEVDNNTIVATCTFEMNYNALPGTWHAKITATDNEALSSSNTGDREVNSNVGLEVDETSINFGSMASGSNSTEAASTTINNMGNVNITPKVSGTNFSCTHGEIPVANVKYGENDVNYDLMGHSLSEDATPDSSNVIPYLDLISEETSQGSEYWTIQIPSDIGGVCSNYITIDAEEVVE